jgi:hypothetical protein
MSAIWQGKTFLCFFGLLHDATSCYDDAELLTDGLMIMEYWWANSKQETKVLGATLVPVPLCTLKVQHGLAWPGIEPTAPK